ncbi:MAG: CoB--CoM heterodisulfide reductase iron-sulfur subunit A family protein, partial [Nitrospirae bacterium]|nr:CoB--CoM heterodisulfide reductase iron-sulfur subunit A family protein [Nitrospirota bacterium]
ISIIHCVGSLDNNHNGYCSEVCCQYAFKFNQMIKEKLPQAKIYHIYKELVLTGKDGFILYDKAKVSSDTKFIRYKDIKDINIIDQDAKILISIEGIDVKIKSDMAVLCPSIVPVEESKQIGKMLDTTLDRFGFFEELHGRCDSAQSKIKGVYLAGTCQSPMDIAACMNQGMAAASYILSGIVEGKKLEIEPITAVIDKERCSGCKVCQLVCPYKAIAFDEKDGISIVNELLCHGCGTCAAACPIGVIEVNHFTTEEIFAEIEGLLA